MALGTDDSATAAPAGFMGDPAKVAGALVIGSILFLAAMRYGFRSALAA